MSDSPPILDTWHNTPVLGISAASGTGKTTLLRAVIPLLVARGIRVGCIKHTHHPFEIDRPGKDSFELRAAGASQMLLGAPGRFALMVERNDGHDAGLPELLARLDVDALDLILVEGFRIERLAKLLVHREELGPLPVEVDDPAILAVATNAVAPAIRATVLDIDNPGAVADFIAGRVGAR